MDGRLREHDRHHEGPQARRRAGQAAPRPRDPRTARERRWPPKATYLVGLTDLGSAARPHIAAVVRAREARADGPTPESLRDPTAAQYGSKRGLVSCNPELARAQFD